MQKDIADKYNAFVTPAGNIIWGGALSLAWQDLKATFKLEQIQLATNNPHILKITNNFNKSPFQIDHISKDSVYVKTGYGPQAQNKINTEMKKKFPKATIGEINFKLNPTDIIAYAYLSKAINFKIKFERKQQQFLFNGNTVPSFWAKSDAQKKQVICHHYESIGEFVVHIADADQKQMMFLVKWPKDLTVDQAISIVNHFQNKPSSALKKQDYFQMPFIELNSERVFEQLAGIPFANNALKQYMIAVVLEKIKLSIDESGAKVENMGVIVATKTKVLNKHPVVPKYIICDRTFWIVMKQPNKHPYFCAQITVPKE